MKFLFTFRSIYLFRCPAHINWYWQKKKLFISSIHHDWRKKFFFGILYLKDWYWSAPLENFYQVSQIAQPAKQNCEKITSKRYRGWETKRNVGFIALTFKLLADGLFIPIHVYLWSKLLREYILWSEQNKIGLSSHKSSRNLKCPCLPIHLSLFLFFISLISHTLSCLCTIYIKASFLWNTIVRRFSC